VFAYLNFILTSRYINLYCLKKSGVAATGVAQSENSTKGVFPMAWEKRGNKFYYFSKKRKGNKVESTYWGSNDIAVRMADIDRNCRIIGQMEKAQKQAIKQEYITLNREIAEIENLVRSLTTAAYLLNGLHRPKGVWRKMRKEPNQEEKNK